MPEPIHELRVEIVAFVDGSFPGWVKCELFDAMGQLHTFVDKYPIFSSELLEPDSAYPRPGSIRCEIIERLQDSGGRQVARVTTARPYGIESLNGISEFVVAADQIVA